MMNVLITGANRGIGLALARKLHDDRHLVVPTYRRKGSAQPLFSLPDAERQNWIPTTYDSREADTVNDLVAFVDKKVTSLDLMINNAGMNSTTSGYPMRTNTLGDLNSEVLLDFLSTNAKGFVPV